MTKNQLLSLFEIDDIRCLPESVMNLLFGKYERRNEIYKELLRLNDYDLSYDWFQNIYEAELAQRKDKKQDFTPNFLGVICSQLVSCNSQPNGCMGRIIHEPTAGNGSMIIADWWENCRKLMPWEHLPSNYMIDCWELSDRAIPILLLNLSIRGIMGYVFHGDVLERNVKQKYILLNRKDDTLAFSDVVKVGITAKIVRDDI